MTTSDNHSLPRWLIFVLLMLAASPGFTAHACEKTLRWDDDPPFSMKLADGSIGGIYVDVHRVALTRLGCKTRLRKLPWARALQELRQGRLDILPGAFWRPEREEYAYFTGPILPPSRNILFMRRQGLERWPVTSLLDLQDTTFRLGAQIDVYYGPDYIRLMRNTTFAAQAAMVTSRAGLWRMLDKGRIDGVIADELTGAYELRQQGLDDQIKATEVVVSSHAAEVALSKLSNDGAFAEEYARTLRQLVADGSYARIMQEYGVR